MKSPRDLPKRRDLLSAVPNNRFSNWLRQMGPAFDAFLTLEFLGFIGPEAREGLAALIEKRARRFPPGSPG